ESGTDFLNGHDEIVSPEVSTGLAAPPPSFDETAETDAKLHSLHEPDTTPGAVSEQPVAGSAAPQNESTFPGVEVAGPPVLATDKKADTKPETEADTKKIRRRSKA